jgi:hypothetical protein
MHDVASTRDLAICLRASGGRLQVGDACAAEPTCFFYRLEDRACSMGRLAMKAGVRLAVASLGYPSLDHFLDDARRYVEATYLLSTFCLTPPGDTPKRRGFIDALLMGSAATCAWPCRL